MQTFCGTPNFASPELVTGTPYDATKSDAWSLGVVLYQLLHPNGTLPFSSPNSLAHLYTLIRACSPDFSMIPFGAASLLRTVFVRDPAKRASVEEMMRDPWTNERGWPEGEAALAQNADTLDEEEAGRHIVGVRRAGTDGEFLVCTVGSVGKQDRETDDGGSWTSGSGSGFVPSRSSSSDGLPTVHPHEIGLGHLPISRRGSFSSASEIASTLSHDILGVGGVVELASDAGKGVPLRRRSSLFDDSRIVLDPGDPSAIAPRRKSWTGAGLPAIGEDSSKALGRRLSEPFARGRVDARPILGRRGTDLIPPATLEQVDEASTPTMSVQLPNPEPAVEPSAEPNQTVIELFHAMHRPASHLRRLSFSHPQFSVTSSPQMETRNLVSKPISDQPARVFQTIHAAVVEAGPTWDCQRPDSGIYCFVVRYRNESAKKDSETRLEIEIFEHIGLLATIMAGLALPKLQNNSIVVRCRAKMEAAELQEVKSKFTDLAKAVIDSVERSAPT
jgi:hypothetical protein